MRPFMLIVILLGLGVLSIIVGPHIFFPRPDLLTGIIRIETPDGFGSGVVVARRGEWYYVATAAHVVTGGDCVLGDERIRLDVLYEDPNSDIAIGKFRDWKKRRVFEFAEAQSGEPCRIHGWYGWFDENKNVIEPTRIVFQGYISCTDLKGDMTTNSGVHPGCSGGPLLNIQDQVLGIASHVPGWGMSLNPTVAVCVPADEIKKVLANILGE